MDCSSEEDIVKKKGWALVNKKGSIENSSDEEQVENVALSKRTPDLPSCQNISTESEKVEVQGAAYTQNLALAPLSFHLPPPESPTLQTPGSNSSGGSTLVSSLPSPLPHLQRALPIDKVEEDLSSVADILKSKVEKEDSQSVDSFDILSEPASGDGEPSMDSHSEDGDDEDTFAPLPSQNVPCRFTSDSDSDFVRLKAPSDMDSAHSGLEEIPQGPSSQSSKDISSSPEPVLPIVPRPLNAPYQDMRGVSSGEESDHVRIMSRRWPTEDGGFLLVQRFKKLEPDDISTVSSSISDFSSFSMMGNSGRQRLVSDTQEAGDSDTESEVSYSSYSSEEPLPVNMMVQNVPPAVRQYLHKRNDVFNSKLTIFTVLVLTAGLTLGIGHFVGSSQMVSHHETVQEGQKLRLRSLQDELVSCMDRRKEVTRLYQEKEKDVHHCIKDKERLLNEISSPRDGDNSLAMRDSSSEETQELRLCLGCRDVGLRYSKFCNTRCAADTMDGHSWVAIDMRSPSIQEYWVHDGSERQGIEAGQVVPSQSKEGDELPVHSVPLSEGIQDVPIHSVSLNEGIQDVPVHSVSLGEEDEEAVPAHLVSLSKSHERVKEESGREESSEMVSDDADSDTLMESTVLHPIIGGDTFREEDTLGSNTGIIDNILSRQEYEVDSDWNTLDWVSVDNVGVDLEHGEEVETTPRSVNNDLLETNNFLLDASLDPDAKWVCVDDAEPEHCNNWIPKADLQMTLEEHKKQEITEEVEDDSIDENGDTQLQLSDESESLSVDEQVGEVLEMNDGENLEEAGEDASGSSKADNIEEREGDALIKSQGEVIEEMEEDLEEKEGWTLKEGDGWVSIESEEETEGANLDCNKKGESTDESRDEQEDNLDVISHALQSAWGIVENASRSIMGNDVSLKDASDIVKEHVRDLKEVVEDAWDSVQTVASQVNKDHIQPVVKKVNKFVKRRWSEAGTGRTCRGKSCKGGRRNNQRRQGNINGHRARKTDLHQRGGPGGRVGKRNNVKNTKNLNIKNQPVPVKSRNVEEQQSQKGRNMKNTGPTRVRKEGPQLISKKGIKKGVKLSEPKQAEINKHVSHSTGPAKSSKKVLGRNVDNIHTKEIKSEYSPTKTTQEAVEKKNIPQSGKVEAKSPPPVLNIEKVLDSMDMSCGGEVRCVENHKIDAARLLMEMISYRQWLWEQRFRKDVDEVEDFMEELEEFIDEEDVDDEDIEDLKDEFEDMVEDIQKTTKKFFRKQERQTKQKASNSGGQSVVEKAKGRQPGERLVQEEVKDEGKPKRGVEKQNKKEKKKRGKTLKAGEGEVYKKDVDGNKPSSKGTGATEPVHTIMFNPKELPSVHMQNSSQQTMSISDNEDEQKDEGLPMEAVVMSPTRGEADKVFHEQKQVGGGYINTDEWFFRRAHDRQRRRKENPDASWYFERFHSWEEERKNKGKNDWYFQRGRNREDSRDCTTQPWHCEWARDESVVTLWEMYKWLTERFAFRADLRAWELEDQINWFLRKP